MIDVTAYLGLRYQRGGREAPLVDCWGLVRLIYRHTFRIDFDLHDATIWVSQQVGPELIAERAAWLPVERAAIRHGDVACMRRIGRPFHVGVVLDGRSLIHADEGIDVRVEPIDRQLGSVEFFRHPALRADPHP